MSLLLLFRGSAGPVAQTGTATANLGRLSAAAIGRPVGKQGSWYSLVSVLAEAREMRAQEPAMRLLACPNDGEPYRQGPRGELYCPWDGYRPDL